MGDISIGVSGERCYINTRWHIGLAEGSSAGGPVDRPFGRYADVWRLLYAGRGKRLWKSGAVEYCAQCNVVVTGSVSIEKAVEDEIGG